MKKLLFVAFLLTSTAALAQTAPSTGAPPALGNGQHQQQHEEKFEEHKAKILAHIQQRQACVQAATTREALKACRPEHRGGHGEHGGQGEGLGGGENH